MKKRTYKIWIFFISQEERPLWEWDNWMQFFEIIDPLLSKTRGNKVLDIFQTLDSGIRINQRPMAWTKKNMGKWTHHSPLTEQYEDLLKFDLLHLWCPSEKKCSEEGVHPDVFMSLSNETNLEGLSRGPVNRVLQIAVHDELLPGPSAEELLENICEVVKPAFFVELTSSWLIKRDDISRTPLWVFREFLKKNWDWSKPPSVEMFDTENIKCEIISSCTISNGIKDRRLYFNPKLSSN